MENPIITIDSYIAQFPAEIQEILIQTRSAIRNVSPELKEKISWGMPTFFVKKNIIHFAAHKKHMGIYPGAEAMVVFAEQLKEYSTSKGAVQFPYNKPIPYDLIAQLTMHNLIAGGFH